MCLTTRTDVTLSICVVEKQWFRLAQCIASLGTRAEDSSWRDVTYRAGTAACPGQGPRGCLHWVLCNLFHSHKCFHFARLSLMIHHHPGVHLRVHCSSTLAFGGFFYRLVPQHLSSPLSFFYSSSLCFYFSKSFLFPRALYFFFFLRTRLGRDSSVDIATLRARRSGDRIPFGTRFSAPVQIGPAAHPASCTLGTASF